MPSFDVVSKVDMQEIDTAFSEFRQCIVEGRTNQTRERPEMRVMKCRPFLEHLFPVKVDVRVAFPRVDRVARGFQPQDLHGLSERGEAVAGVRAELDDGARTQGIDEPEREWNVGDPAGGFDQSYRPRERHRPQQKLTD